MALITSKDIKRISPPFEPETWFEVRPIRAGDFEGLEVVGGSQIRLSLDLLTALLSAWSYEEELTRETVAFLDTDTFTWLNSEIQTLSGIRSDDEKKVSANGLSPTSRRLAIASPTSSVT